MPPNLALCCGFLFVGYALWADRKRGVTSVPGVFWPWLWYMVVASRPIGIWLSMWGIPLPGGSGDATEGSLVDRYFFAGLMVIGLWVLSQRGFNWGTAIRLNPWVAALLVVMALSIVWSSYPYVSFKRFVKVVGSVVMALVILSHPQSLDAFRTVLRRCLYIHLPMSIICTKYFRDIGVSFDWSGSSESWVGIATSKNTLGQIAMLGVLYFSWEVWRAWRKHGWRNHHLAFLLMAAYLLKGSGEAVSKTSLVVCLFALGIFYRMQSLRLRSLPTGPFVRTVFYGTLALITVVLVHSVVHFSENSLFGQVITAFGRDITLTDRTYIWSDVYAAVSNPLLGVGYGGFWIGRLANIPWNASMTWVLGQAHSGYVDTYLQIGLVGGFLLGGILFSSLPRLLASLDHDFDFGALRIALFLTIMFVNITESTYLRGDHHLWMIFLLTVIWVPAPEAQKQKVESRNRKSDLTSDFRPPPFALRSLLCDQPLINAD